MPALPALPARPVLLVALLGLAVAGCGSSGSGSTGSSSSVAIKAGDSTCDVATTSFPEAGKVSFAVENTGKDTTEVYVYGKGSGGDFDKVVGEVENIAPGTNRDFQVSLASGSSYEIACKPGQKGSGIRTTVTVGGAAASTSATAAYDREVEVQATDYAFAGLAGFTAKVGEKVELKLENKSTSHEHELEVFDPSGKNIGEVGPTGPGKDGEVIITFAVPGTYRYASGVADDEAKGMAGVFTVS